MSEKVKQKLLELTDNIAKLESIVFQKKVSWETVENWEVGKTKRIGDSVNTKIFGDDNILVFLTTIPAGFIFPPHWHDYNESNYVISGVYYDNGIYAEKGEWVRYNINKIHEVQSVGEAELKLLVIFTKK
jgi:quercetin dioxygenase-like cupin family protein